MRTTENRVNERKESKGTSVRTNRDNNYNILRCAAAMLIFCGHQAEIMGGSATNFCGFAIQDLGVRILFLISGCLITESWLHDPHPVRFTVRRFFRFWVPFAVMILLMVFVAGPLLSDYGVVGYFHAQEPAAFTYYLKNLRLYIVFAQPGVFSKVPRPYQTNGSLWTMPVEAMLYVLTPILLTLFGVRKRGEKAFYPMAIFVGAVCAVDLYFKIWRPDARLVLYAMNLVFALHVIAYYLIGMLFSFARVRKHLHLEAAIGLVVLFLMVDQMGAGLKELLLFIALPYLVFSFAYAPGALFRQFGKKVDPAYGIYLYGFFFSQVAVQLLGADAGYTKLFLISFPLTVLAAVLSDRFVEKPAIRAGRKLIARISL